ncbi:glycosyltransferase family 2 protein, partial [bacterium]|nr:glycosyltransferase family 2 protein [bacterium]
PEQVTVLITYYNPSRMKHIEYQIRNILKCNFVEKLIISNHNPDIQLENRTIFRDKRLVFLNQNIKRGCGYRWEIASSFNPEFLIVLDDDILIFPSQIAELFKHSVSEPEIPHGYTGMLHLENKEFEYHERVSMKVDYLCEIYAVTRSHLNQYKELEKVIGRDVTLADMIESSVDFMVISQTGSNNPKIHKTGRIFRCTTFNDEGVAVHKEDGFRDRMFEIHKALEEERTQ